MIWRWPPATERKPLDRAGLSIGEFVGYRIWEIHLIDNVPTLRSWVYECFWQPFEFVSDISVNVLGYSSGEGIADHNERGVWAYKTLELRNSEFHRGIMCYQHNIAWGTCYMWGTIIEHEKGYRAQYASVRSIELIDDMGELRPPITTLDELRHRYGVEDVQ